jgi:dTDP-4-amino-4,6-dideoxygalactose transaminase
MGGTEQSYIQEAFDVNWISTAGPQIDTFEKELVGYTGNKHVAALASGTAAIHLALKILGVGSGDAVICQTFTFAGSAFPITYQGAKPVFIDSEPDTWNMDPDLLEESVQKIIKSTNKPPKAIIPVHLYGMPYNIKDIHEIAARYAIPVIEDAAEALGSTVNEQQ